MASGLARSCPVCFSKPGYPCTRPTDNGRANVDWVHFKRQEEEEQEDEPSVQ